MLVVVSIALLVVSTLLLVVSILLIAIDTAGGLDTLIAMMLMMPWDI